MNSELSALAKKTYTYEKKEGEMMIDLDVKLTTTNLFIFLYPYLLTASFFFIHEQHLKEMVKILKQYLSYFTNKIKKWKIFVWAKNLCYI